MGMDFGMGGGGGSGSISGFMGFPSIGAIANNQWQNQENSWQADHAMDRSEDMAREEMAFQERMSNTAYQRATADMQKAGINPMVAFQQGGASTPGGAMGQGFKAEMTGPLTGAMSSAMDAVRLKKELGQADSQNALNSAMATNSLAQAQSAGSSAKMTDLNAKAIQSQLGSIAAKAKTDTLKAGYDASAAKYDAIMSRANRDTGTAKNLMNLFNPFSGASGSGPKPWQGQTPDGSTYDRGTGEIVSP